ncbi:uncharacterized protein LOC129761787 isoform X2 [Toxorhynchites rutilus septentrionalis]|uniref:uncharacterized protein LOC129761787 isoform X2 n=1 Tax=Toxorhynchites rutilus septentrionalis TaxID=329112 RepID=UPI00247A6BE7|nr:uncharacterized protein LOC129761787 isoform X2 [Toxorhynchites rutilus septentrionalis]
MKIVYKTKADNILMNLPQVLPCPGIATNEVHIDCDEEMKMVNSRSKSTTPIVEYFKEHEVSEKDSKMALDALDLDLVSQVPAWCNECSLDKIHFCRSAAFINDHCCCEHRHAREKLPWIPHTCYLGKERCQPHTSSCSKYREIRQCCCDRLLIADYKAKFSTGSPTCSRSHKISWILSVLVTSIYTIRLS